MFYFIVCLLLDVFHELKLSSRGVDLDGVLGCQGVNQFAQNLTVTKGILVRSIKLFTDDGFDPCLSFAFLSSISFARNLYNIDYGSLHPILQNQMSIDLLYLSLNLSLQHFRVSFVWRTSEDMCKLIGALVSYLLR